MSQRKFLFSFLLLVISCIVSTHYVATAQSNVFTPAADNAVQLSSIYAKLEEQYRKDIAALPAENRKDIAEIYKLRWENIKEKFDKNEIYTSEIAQQYLNKLVAEITKANPALSKQNFTCYFSRSGVPNASYIGEGVILFNMGLFSRLDNESQAAFVLCHELAHFYLNHSDNSIREYVRRVNSKEIQQELRKIKNAEFKKREELEKLLKGLTFNTRRHSRDHESEADSMAVVFMRNTKFTAGESITTLALLDSIDSDTIQTDVLLKKMLNSRGYPFKDKWLAKEEGLLSGHAILKEDEPMDDSLKTHPDCKLRIEKLGPYVATSVVLATAKDIVDKATFEKLKTTFRYEIIEHAFVSDNYAGSLYYTLRLFQANPSDPYLITQVGKIFNGFYNAQKNHTLGKVASLPAPYYPPAYNLLLQFIQNLYKEDFASISYNFLNQYRTRLLSYAPFKVEYDTSIRIALQ